MRIEANLFSLVTAAVLLLTASTFGTVLLSKEGGINLYHHHQISLQSNAVQTECSGLISKTCHIVFGKSIASTEKYSQLITLLYSASSRDTIYLYFTGDGGYVDTALMLNSAIKKTKAKTITVVTGDVYSAHALLAVSGKEIVVANPRAIIMFHRSSIYNIEDVTKHCTGRAGNGTDRRHSAVSKCVALVNASMKQDELAVKTIYKDILTKDEIKRVLQGHDVYITGEELSKRISEG